ncbi:MULTISPECIES: AAA family ATPase [unclassified Crossiella]|uniref:AAA family ATPase n=1 Tax=unclassified Crossiella TaxID=2620835 RepID=UPI001FFE97C7|nr:MULTISPECIES: AAA family ATPase [unclassified Crossiella]MCK2242235.1 ATP-binding protein [Crossiella sp. S99.2]MCK2254734.1 ATP-binding protein [Crossiella sp. S99.1]
MLLWINGTFGAGKTQVAHEIQRRLPGSHIADPEHFGAGMHRMMPRDSRGDFQDIPLWRTGTREMLDQIAPAAAGVVIVPMTLVNPAYYEEIIGWLRERGHEVSHHTLVVPDRELLLRRLRSRGETRNGWAALQYDRCAPALADPLFATHVPTVDRTVAEVAELVAAGAGLRLLPNRDNALTAQLRRWQVQLRHIRVG